jgi:hypothetical protein
MLSGIPFIIRAQESESGGRGQRADYSFIRNAC